MQCGTLGMFLQLTSCYLQLMIIVGLCLDGGKSDTSRFLKTRLMQFLGRISMGLYLFHEPLIFWINFCIYGMAKLVWIRPLHNNKFFQKFYDATWNFIKMVISLKNGQKFRIFNKIIKIPYFQKKCRKS